MQSKSPDIFEDDDFIFLDVEASSIENGYPIEIAWINAETGEKDSFLIKPSIEWLRKYEWAIDAMGVHGITPIELHQKGVSIEDAVERLNELLANKIVYCDALDFDGRWLEMLYSEANEGSTWLLADVMSFYQYKGKDYTQAFKGQLYNHQLHKEKRHRALHDCQPYIDVFLKMQG